MGPLVSAASPHKSSYPAASRRTWIAGWTVVETPSRVLGGGHPPARAPHAPSPAPQGAGNLPPKIARRVDGCTSTTRTSERRAPASLFLLDRRSPIAGCALVAQRNISDLT